ncbi:7915_t:CDS:2, partial [Ambispora gerdemannii]
YRLQQVDLSFSFRKGSDKLKKDLDNLIKDGSDKAKAFTKEGFHNYGGICLLPALWSAYVDMFWENIEMHEELHLLEKNASRSIMNGTTKVLETTIENIHSTAKYFLTFSDLAQIKTTQIGEQHEVDLEKFEASKPFKIFSTGESQCPCHPFPTSSSLWKDTIPFHFVCLLRYKEPRSAIQTIFGDLYIGKNPTPLASSFLVLELNFSGIRTSTTFDIFEESFHKRLNLFMSRFVYRYQQELEHHFQIVDENMDALTNLLRLLNSVELSDYKENKIELIESSFKQFYSCLRTACDRGIAYVFQTGVTPVVMAEFTSGFNISSDLALSEEFWDLHGFKKSEVELLLDNALGNSLPSDVKEGIVKCLKEENDRYFFNINQTEGIFNTARILYCIRMLIRQMKFIDYNEDSSIVIKNFLRFPPDPNTLPSQTTLDLIVNNTLGKSIFTEALNRSPLESRNGIEQQFRLTSIRELATDRTRYYRSCSILVPSHINRIHCKINFESKIVFLREFIAEALKIYDWKEEI